MTTEDLPRPPETSANPEQPSPRPPGSEPESAWAFWRSVLITLAVALGIRQFLMEARFIPSGSMLPGLEINDRLLVEKLSAEPAAAPRRNPGLQFPLPF